MALSHISDVLYSIFLLTLPGITIPLLSIVTWVFLVRAIYGRVGIRDFSSWFISISAINIVAMFAFTFVWPEGYRLLFIIFFPLQATLFIIDALLRKMPVRKRYLTTALVFSGIYWIELFLLILYEI